MGSHYVTPRVVGIIKFCDSKGIIDKIFEHNPTMNDLYPGENRDILEGSHVIAEGAIYLIDFKKNTLKYIPLI